MKKGSLSNMGGFPPISPMLPLLLPPTGYIRLDSPSALQSGDLIYTDASGVGNFMPIMIRGKYELRPFKTFQFTAAQARLPYSNAYAGRNYNIDMWAHWNGHSIEFDFSIWDTEHATITNIDGSNPPIVTLSSAILVPAPATGMIVTITGNATGANNDTWRIGTVTSTTVFRIINLDGSNPGARAIGGGGDLIYQDRISPVRSRIVEYVDGVPVWSNDKRYRYLGTIRTNQSQSGDEINDNPGSRNIFNQYNRRPKRLYCIPSNTSWTTSSSTAVFAAGKTILGETRCDFVWGDFPSAEIPYSPVEFRYDAFGAAPSGSGAAAGIGVNNYDQSVDSADQSLKVLVGHIPTSLEISPHSTPFGGYNFLQLLVRRLGSVQNVTFQGNNTAGGVNTAVSPGHGVIWI